jgi:hypothetical protein
MGYDSKGILVLNLKYEHAISFIQFGQIYYQMSITGACVESKICSLCT